MEFEARLFRFFTRHLHNKRLVQRLDSRMFGSVAKLRTSILITDDFALVESRTSQASGISTIG